jgi:hypothetical protein
MIDIIYQESINRNYSNPDLVQWNRWLRKYVNPAFDPTRYEEMAKNFGYITFDKHDFVAQNAIFIELQSENRLDDETKMFIGFMAGVCFFKHNRISLNVWMNSPNWYQPNQITPDQKSINELLNYENGLNYLKVMLPSLPFWKR